MKLDFASDFLGCQGIVFFDGECRFCRWALKKLLSRDITRKLKVCNVRSDRGRALMESYGRRPESTFGYLTPKQMHFDVEAYDALLNGPAPIPGLGVMVAKMPRALSKLAYLAIANNRPFFSSLVPPKADVTIDANRYIADGM
ncbi:Hypothetical protein NGAL_HAMBI1189_40840 [Neorhizobium galegae bv. officinalis]|uniref:Thiol-disulfide oxidoreductase DCC n=2 Tax=Neorhizobium galegae TaxID=399 RepID=A0A0T7GWH4_NEOGA|nr:Hypothetical protein NGAL_HAMBI1189_40840 [Neorhizobium galegae bv. officinalis]